MIRRGAVLALALCACNRGEAKVRSDDKPADDAADPWRHGAAIIADEPCARLPFAETLPIAEASAAVFLADGMLVVADSGNAGAYVILDPDTGAVRSHGALPLGAGASDDLEGLAVAPDGVLWGVTSSGYLRAWRRDGAGFALIDGPYGLGARLACEAGSINCGANLEGLCLSPKVEPDDGCVGFVASKTDGKLHCLVRDGARLRAEPRVTIAVTDPEALADCAFDPTGDAVWTGGNLFDGGLVSKVTGWRDPADVTVTAIGSLGVGLPEVIAVGDAGVIYRFSDSGTTPSLAGRWNCGAK